MKKQTPSDSAPSKTAPPPKAKLKLPPKTSTMTAGGKITQAIDTSKVYILTTRSTRGKKILVYGASGIGKTTITATIPDSVFVSVDDGADVVMHPITGEPLKRYTARTYQDVRNILGRPELFKDFKTIILDNMTEVENIAVPYILSTVTKDGKSVKNLEGYGWGAGYGHVADHDTYVKYDLQRLADMGFNVVVICQMAPRKEPSAEVEEYLKDGPKLVWRPSAKAFSVTEFVEWSDYCFKIGYTNMSVSNKRVTASNERVVFVHPEPTFEAKARDIPARFPRVSFESPEDTSIWQFVFDQAWKDFETDEAPE